jgi:hypothetical protein
MFKKDKYHNCFKAIDESFNKGPKKGKKHVKNSKERLNDVVFMLQHFGVSTQDIEVIKQNWFLLEEE